MSSAAMAAHLQRLFVQRTLFPTARFLAAWWLRERINLAPRRTVVVVVVGTCAVPRRFSSSSVQSPENPKTRKEDLSRKMRRKRHPDQLQLGLSMPRRL
jgi:hypothetical protein